MADIQVKCPTTDRLVSTGFDFPTLDGIDEMDGNQFQCPECGEMHTWSIRGGVLEVE